MAKFIRYSLATFCFVASVGCLFLWWRSMTYLDRSQGPIASRWVLDLASFHGIAEVGLGRDSTGQIASMGWMRPPPTTERPEFDLLDQTNKGVFGYSEEYETLFFPHWYVSIVFALAGVGVSLFRWQFSIRSVLMCVSVVALLLGIAVALKENLRGGSYNAGMTNYWWKYQLRYRVASAILLEFISAVQFSVANYALAVTSASYIWFGLWARNRERTSSTKRPGESGD